MARKKLVSDLSEIELLPDAWKRFEGFVKSSVRTARPAKAKAATSRAKRASSKRKTKA
jgi:hypothetical protein